MVVLFEAMRGKWYNSLPGSRACVSGACVNFPLGRCSMAKRCAICGKEPQYGHHVSHAKNRVNRRFEPNLQMGRVTVKGKTFRARVCTRCLRTYSA